MCNEEKQTGSYNSYFPFKNVVDKSADSLIIRSLTAVSSRLAHERTSAKSYILLADNKAVFPWELLFSPTSA